MMTTVYYDFWPTIRFRRLHNAIKMRASLRRRRLFTAANSGFWRYRNTRARDLATYQTVFSNGSCRNLIKVIRLIPRNNINSLFLSWSPVFFFVDAPRLFVIDKLTVNIYTPVDPIPRDPRNSFAVPYIYTLLLL